MHTGTYDVQEYFTKLKIVHQGQTLWEASWTNIPAIVHLESGENMEGFLRKASSSPTYKFYDEIALPEILAKALRRKQPRRVANAGHVPPDSARHSVNGRSV